jgi:O-6-methylguanine DNA methyltransferase
MGASWQGLALAQLRFPEPTVSPDTQAKGALEPLMSDWLEITSRAVKAVLAGRTPDDFPPFDLSVGTPFQKQVWQAIFSIGNGETLSYGEIAIRIGSPRAVRAVGGACGANPIPLLIPCHRVLARNQGLGGFSGGLQWKRLLLEREAFGLFAGAANNSKLLRA